MNRWTTTILALLFVNSAQAFGSGTGRPNDEHELRMMEYTWVAAVSSGQHEQLQRMIDDEYMEIMLDGRQRTKTDLLNAHPLSADVTQELREMEVSVTGNTATVTGINRVRFHPQAQPQDFRFVDTFIRRSSGWKVIRSQMSR